MPPPVYARSSLSLVYPPEVYREPCGQPPGTGKREDVVLDLHIHKTSMRLNIAPELAGWELFAGQCTRPGMGRWVVNLRGQKVKDSISLPRSSHSPSMLTALLLGARTVLAFKDNPEEADTALLCGSSCASERNAHPEITTLASVSLFQGSTGRTPHKCRGTFLCRPQGSGVEPRQL